MRRLALILGLVLVGAAARAPAAELTLDPRACATAPRDRQADRVAAEAATLQVEAEHKTRMAEFEDSEEAFSAAQQGYEQARRRVLYPLAAQGNAAAVYGLAQIHRQNGAGDPEWLRLLKCASDLGDPAAQVEQFRVLWHDKGDGSFETIQRNRAAALDLVERAAAAGDLGGIGAIGVYTGFGQHQYPLNEEIARRAFALCAQLGDRFCQARLLEAAEQGRPFALQDPAESYILAEMAAAAQPGMYAKYVPVLRARLSEAELQDAWETLVDWRPASWAGVKAEWADLRRDILASGCTASVACVLGKVCACPPRSAP
jgi:hypothetical protein